MFLDTDDELRPLLHHVPSAQRAFGQNVLHRVAIIREDLECIGAQGLISLIAAMIANGEHTKEELLDEGDRICGPQVIPAFEALLDELQGADPLHHLWTETKAGTYRLTAKH